MTETPLPLRPLVSLRILTMPSPFVIETLEQLHFLKGIPHLGQLVAVWLEKRILPLEFLF